MLHLTEENVEPLKLNRIIRYTHSPTIPWKVFESHHPQQTSCHIHTQNLGHLWFLLKSIHISLVLETLKYNYFFITSVHKDLNLLVV